MLRSTVRRAFCRAGFVVGIVASSMVALAACASGGAEPRDGQGPAEGGKPDAVSQASLISGTECAANVTLPAGLEPVAGAGKVLVVFYSQGETTRRVALTLAALTGADVEEVREIASVAAKRSFFNGGRDGMFRVASKIEKPVRDPASYDAVYVCTPVWAWHVSPPIRSWLRLWIGTLPKVAFVTVSGDTEPDKIAKDMGREAKAKPFAVAGFADRHFQPEREAEFAALIESLIAPLRKP